MQNNNNNYNTIRRLLLNYLTNSNIEADEPEEDEVDFDSLIVDEELASDQICDLQNHPISEEMMNAVGNTKQAPSIYKMLSQREAGIGGTSRVTSSPYKSSSLPNSSITINNTLNNCNNSFSKTDQNNITQRLLPNKSSTILDHNANIFCGQYSANGSMFMTASKDAKLRIFDTQHWSLLNTVNARNIGWSIISTDFSPNEQWIIYSTWSDHIHLANTCGEHSIHEALQIVPHQATRFCLFSIQFSNDNKEIIGGSSDQCIYIYDLERKTQVNQIFAHQDDVNTVTFLDNSCQLIVSGSDDTLIRVWDRRILSNQGDKGCVSVLPGHIQGITYIDSRQDGRYIVSNGKDQCAKLWDLRKTQQPNEAMARAGNAFSGWYGGYGSHVNNRSNPRQRHKNDFSLMTYKGHSVVQTLIRVKFSPQSTGQKYIYTGSGDGNVYVYDILTGEIVKTLRGHDSIVRDVSWHPHRPEIISTSWDGFCKQWTWSEYDGDPDHYHSSHSLSDDDIDNDDDLNDDDSDDVDIDDDSDLNSRSQEGDDDDDDDDDDDNEIRNDHDLDEFF